MAMKRRQQYSMLPKAKRPRCPDPQWSMLPKDLLEMVLARLDLAGHTRFASVCSWWRWVAVENPPTNKPLALVHSVNPGRLVGRLLTSFWPSWVSARFIGCLEEWLVVLIGNNRELFLLNVYSRERIPLPTPDRSLSIEKAVLSSPPSSAAGNCTVVLKGHLQILAFCKLGDKSFTRFYTPPSCTLEITFDLIFYKEQLYAVDDRCRLKVFDSGLDSPPTQLLRLLPNHHALVVWCDKLLALVHLDARGWKVFEVDPTPKSGSVEVPGSLGRDAVLLIRDDQCCLPFSARGGHDQDFRRNHIYSGADYSCFSLDNRAYKALPASPWMARDHHDQDFRRMVFFALFSRRGFKQT